MNIFETTDPLKRTVVLTEEQYYNHILGDHPGDRKMRELCTFYAESVVHDPEVIYESSTADDSRVFLKYSDGSILKKGPLRLNVIVNPKDNPSTVVTTYCDKNNSGESNRGREAIIYERSTGATNRTDEESKD